MRGFFLTFEGVEGSGKSTQIRRLAEALQKEGKKVLVTREPGGTPIGDQIRKILLDPAFNGMFPIAETLLYAANRHQHVKEIILPALKNGTVVLCDRYADATMAYQGFGRNVDIEFLKILHEHAAEGLQPDITILMDCDPEVGLRRALGRQQKDPSLIQEGRFENEHLSFHRKVREGYLQLAKEEPKRFRIFDAMLSPSALHEKIFEVVSVPLLCKEGVRGR